MDLLHSIDNIFQLEIPIHFPRRSHLIVGAEGERNTVAQDDQDDK